MHDVDITNGGGGRVISRLFGGNDMKKISIMLLVLTVLFAFSACDGNSVPAAKVGSYDELVSAIGDGEKNIVITKGFTIDDKLTVDVDGLTIHGDGNTLTVNKSFETDYVVNVTGSDVTFDGINFVVEGDARGVYLIQAGNVSSTGFTMKNCTVKGEVFPADGSAFTGTDEKDCSVAIGLNTGADATVECSTFTDCYTPVYVNQDTVTMDKVAFNSGISFGVAVSADNLSGLTTIADGKYKKASLDFTDAGEAADDELLAALRGKFPEITVKPEAVSE